MKKFISALLCVATLVGVAGCAKKDNVKLSADSEYVEHLQSGTLHKISVTENSSRVFVKGGSSDYVIVLGEDFTEARRAATFIQSNVKSATGVTLQLAESTEATVNGWTSDKKYIAVGCDDMFAKAGLTMPTDNLGESGYYIKTVGNTVFIACPEKLGYQTGAIAFLNHVLGYDMLAEGCVIYEKNGATIPDMDIVEKPDYDYRTLSNFSVGKDAAYGMGFNMNTLNDMFIPVPNRTGKGGANAVHNSYDYLPPSMYLEEHPDWYSHAGTKASEQLCYTAHGAYLTAEKDKAEGKKNEYNKMVETLYEYLKELVDSHPDMQNITITHQDNQAYCDCEACTAAVKKYGAISSVYIMFLNDVDKLLQADLEREAEESGKPKRLMNILFFAYHGTKDSPTKKDENGNYVATYPEVMMRKNVGVFVAAIESYYTNTFYDEKNVELGESELIKSWSALTDNVYMWLYSTHFSNYMYPYGSWGSTIENYRFCYENNGIYMFNEAQINQKNPTGFNKFKEYIDSKALVNVNLKYSDLEEKFFKYYFDAAAEPMLNFFREVQSHLTYIYATSSTVSGTIYDLPETSDFWKERTLKKYLSYIDEAYAAIEKYKTDDPERYESVRKRILTESIFPRYALLDFYAGHYSSDELADARESFIADNDLLKNTQLGESKSLKDLYSTWGY